MNLDVTIRQATIHDLNRLIPIFDSFREYFKQQRNPDAVEKFLFERFEHQESIIFIAEQQNEIIGYAHLYPTFSSLTLQRVWILNDFFIIEKFRQNGIGKQLLAAVKEFGALTKAKGIELSVEHSNEAAWKFYENQGFQLDKEFRYYFYKL
ncbi:GNAT family N-acetyltransferase [Bacillus sp. 03113]|uniref:GNAT family N-acetyltransferase n=1 Tax=Bacillus sp. 03113 TaxID=2578211 RepID=UPI0011433D65|nr:GNAT family N-acetyltransferase [Bacillus sp. 03113]